MRLGLACLILVTGCDLYFTDGDDDPPCANGGAVPVHSPELRNPDTGVCQPFGNFECNESCGPCPDFVGDVAPNPDWGACFQGCESLDEPGCLVTPGCRAAYDANSNVDEPPRFMECWAIAPSGPVGGPCNGLDAYGCSQHDNCSAYYDTEGGGPLDYVDCRPEKEVGECTSDEQCGPGGHCTTSDGECLPSPGCGANADCPAVCFGRCVGPEPVACEALPTETACLDRTDCRGVYTGENCTCYSDQICDCEILNYTRCEAK
jgi:hypothetical protein